MAAAAHPAAVGQDGLDGGVLAAEARTAADHSWLHDTQRFSSVAVQAQRTLALRLPGGAATAGGAGAARGAVFVTVLAVFEPASLRSKRSHAAEADEGAPRPRAERDFDSKPMMQAPPLRRCTPRPPRTPWALARAPPK
jgi:hypothetical protein